MAVFPYLKGYAISITGENLRDNLWAELATWRQKSRFLTEMFEWQAEKYYCKESPENWFISARQWSRSADRTQQSNTLAGLHADHTLVVIDEAGDIPSAVIETADASLATGKWNRIIMAGNPTQTSGPLYDACTVQRHLWHVIEITGDPDNPKRASRIKIEWAKEKIAQWGRDNPWVLINVFGEFPPTGTRKLLGPDDCVKSTQRHLEDVAWKPHAKIMSVDPARYGDDKATIGRRQGRLFYRPSEYRGLDTIELARQVLREIREWDPDVVFIDITGQGVGVYDYLVSLGQANIVRAVNFGEKASEPVRFLNRRAEIIWRASEWVKNEGMLPNQPELWQELTAPDYEIDEKGRMKIMSKDDIKELIQRSPDLADALYLTFAELHVQPRFQAPSIPEWAVKRQAEMEYDVYGPRKLR